MNIDIALMLDLIDELNRAASLYYNTGTSFLTDKEYDEKLRKLQEYEKYTGVVLSNSPTVSVGAEVLDSIPKISLGDRPMLSLAKVHSQAEIDAFAGGKEIIGSYKLDGLSVRICYRDGKIAWAATRGNGTTGSDITRHIPHFKNVPLTIPLKEEYIIDGEAIITKADFNAINTDGKYKNPRNLAAGTLSLLDTKEVAERNLRFIGWDVIKGDDSPLYKTKIKHAEYYGFEVICPYSKEVSNDAIIDIANCQGFPCDGVVWRFNDVAYGESLGATSHHFNNGIAWKPTDESAWTRMINIEWTMGRTGVLTPVAVFEPVELEGSEVERASLHNISVMLETFHGTPWVDQSVEVFKANMIIPQIADAEDVSDSLHYPELPFIEIPTICPICGGSLEQITEVDSTVLVCPAADCPGKLLNKIDHFCSKKGMDIKGLSKSTIIKLMDWGWLDALADLYHLHEHRAEWIQKPGFGVRSVDNILQAIEASRISEYPKFLAAIGIPQIGTSMVKDIVMHPDLTNYDDFRAAVNTRWDFTTINGIGPEKAHSILTFDYTEADNVYKELTSLTSVSSNEIATSDMKNVKCFEGMTIVITGTLETFKNRNELVDFITERGGKVTGSVSKNTTILINNDVESNSSKNRDAKRLGVPIMSEKKFLENFLTF